MADIIQIKEVFGVEMEHVDSLRVYLDAEDLDSEEVAECKRDVLAPVSYTHLIGVEGYSIVGQGRVNEILSGNPDDRRAIFEEASGIGLYRSRKVDSLRRLERSEQNLEMCIRDRGSGAHPHGWRRCRFYSPKSLIGRLAWRPIFPFLKTV